MNHDYRLLYSHSVIILNLELADHFVHVVKTSSDRLEIELGISDADVFYSESSDTALLQKLLLEQKYHPEPNLLEILRIVCVVNTYDL